MTAATLGSCQGDVDEYLAKQADEIFSGGFPATNGVGGNENISELVTTRFCEAVRMVPRTEVDQLN